MKIRLTEFYQIYTIDNVIMYKKVSALLSFCALFALIFGSTTKPPTVVISILARNKAHTLPYFLSLLENLNYPKDRISLWIRSDHNIDNTLEILRKWVDNTFKEYHSINTKFVEDQSYPDETGSAHWSPLRFNHTINLRESALNYAREIWADYFLSIDSDVFLINPDTLDLLISKNLSVVAPMLKSVGMYSNFWYGMSENYYYLRTDEYEPVLNRENKTCYKVPMIHSCVLIDLRQSETDFLTYIPDKVINYDGPRDDIIIFAISANKSDIDLNVCNDHIYGFMMQPMEQDDSLEYDYHQLQNLKLEVLVENESLYVNSLLAPYTWLPDKDTLGFEKIFMINLLRRPDRRQRMEKCFDELGLDVTTFDAIDGKSLDNEVLDDINFLPGYADPYHKRPMTLGEIGCFLSHYEIWKEVVEKGHKQVLVLEDDVRFEPFFRSKVEHLLDDLQRLDSWDLVYFGRKRLQDSDEPWVEGSSMLVKASYSYWTLGYALSLKGAQKLLDAEPLSRLLPVDEYLPILFDKHPQSSWKGHFAKRDLIAFSVAPLLLYPTHYTGEKGYISDTEDSNVVEIISPRSDL